MKDNYTKEELEKIIDYVIKKHVDHQSICRLIDDYTCDSIDNCVKCKRTYILNKISNSGVITNE